MASLKEIAARAVKEASGLVAALTEEPRMEESKMRRFGSEMARLMKSMELAPREHIVHLLGIILMLGDEMGLSPERTLALVSVESAAVVDKLRAGGLIRRLPESMEEP